MIEEISKLSIHQFMRGSACQIPYPRMFFWIGHVSQTFLINVVGIALWLELYGFQTTTQKSRKETKAITRIDERLHPLPSSDNRKYQKQNCWESLFTSDWFGANQRYWFYIQKCCHGLPSHQRCLLHLLRLSDSNRSIPNLVSFLFSPLGTVLYLQHCLGTLNNRNGMNVGISVGSLLR